MQAKELARGGRSLGENLVSIVFALLENYRALWPKYVRDRGAAVPVMAGGAAVPAMRSRGEGVPLIQGRVARLRPRAQPLRLPHDLAKENIFRALLPLVYACQHANWR